jgi:hypothetical protein
MLEKSVVTIKNGRSRDIDNIGHTRHRTKTNKLKRKNTPQKTKNNDWNTRESIILFIVFYVDFDGNPLFLMIYKMVTF